MIVRSRDEAFSSDLSRTWERLLPQETFEGNTHLSEFTLIQVLEEFWPPSQGWQVVAAEPGFFSVLFVLEHPTLGVGACMLGATAPGAGTGSEETWETLDVAVRARNIYVSHHAHGPTRLDLLEQFLDLLATGELFSLDESMLARLTTSPAFMDETTTTMVALNDSYDPLLRRVDERRARQRHQDPAPTP